MPEDVFFSIIIPGYNSENYIRQTLQSLADQTYQSFEIILIDDGSSDATIQVAETAIHDFDMNALVIARPQNIVKGVASCRNYGVSLAKGNWISFLDSDDLFKPEKLETTKGLIDKYADDCLAYHHASRQFDDATGDTINITCFSKNSAPEDISSVLSNSNVIVTSTVTISKKLHEELGGFNIDLHGVEDYFMWLRVAKKTKWCYTDAVLTDYRVRSTSLMSGRSMSYYIGQNSALLKKARDINEFTRSELYHIEHYLFDNLMQYYAMVSINTHGWKDFRKGIRLLFVSGKVNLAFRLYTKHAKSFILRLLVDIFTSRK